MSRPLGRYARWALAATAVLAGTEATGCSDEGPNPRLFSVSPDRAFTDRPQRLRLTGGELLPQYHYQLTSGERHPTARGFSGVVGSRGTFAPLRDFAVIPPGVLEATLDPGLPASSEPYDVVITDPRGVRAILARTFTALGPDRDPPRLEVLAPNSSARLAPGTPVTARISASDQDALAGLTWQVTGPDGPFAHGACLGPTGPSAPGPREWVEDGCDFQFLIPRALRTGDTVSLRVTATDRAPAANRAALTRTFVLDSPPRLLSLRPARGGSSGGTDVVIETSAAPPGTQIFFGDRPLEPNGGTRVDARTVVGRTPPGGPGPVVVRLVTPLGEVPEDRLFEYLPTPRPLALEPAAGAGGTHVRVLGEHFGEATQIFVGPTLATARALLQPAFVGPGEIRGVLPPGEGIASVFALDPEAGLGELPRAFSWKQAP